MYNGLKKVKNNFIIETSLSMQKKGLNILHAHTSFISYFALIKRLFEMSVYKNSDLKCKSKSDMVRRVILICI